MMDGVPHQEAALALPSKRQSDLAGRVARKRLHDQSVKHLMVAVDQIDRAVEILSEAGYAAQRYDWSINFTSKSQVSIQLSTEDFYKEFPARSVPADVHGILLRVASLEDTLAGKIKAWSDPGRRRSKRIKDLTDIARLVEAHPQLRDGLPADVNQALDALS